MSAWAEAMYAIKRLSKEDEDVKDESNSVTSQNTILDEFVERNQNDNEEQSWKLFGYYR